MKGAPEFILTFRPGIAPGCRGRILIHPFIFTQLACKPVSVSFRLLQKELETLPSFILITYRYVIHTTYPPASGEQPSKPVYMVFQLIRCTAPDVASGTGKLLPHLFTLIPIYRDGFFLLHYYTLTDIFPLGSMMLCVDRTFLPFKRKGDRTACCPAKVINCRQPD